LKVHQSIEIAQAQQKKVFNKQVKKEEFKEDDLVMMFDIQHVLVSINVFSPFYYPCITSMPHHFPTMDFT